MGDIARHRPGRRGGWEQLVHFHDPRCFYDGRFFLALGKARCAFAVNIHAGKLLAIVVIDGHLPVSVLASAVAVIATAPLRSLLHDLISPRALDYGKFRKAAQVTS